MLLSMMNHRLLHLAILSCHIFTTFGALVTLSTFVEVTKTLSPGEVPPTASNLEPGATATSKAEHTITQDSPQSQKPDTAPPPAPASTTAGTTIQSTSLDPILSTTKSGISALISVTTTAVPYSTLPSSVVESPTSYLSSPSPTKSAGAGSTVNQGTIIGGASAAGAVLVALLAAAYFWWRRRRRRSRDTPATSSRNHNKNESNVSEPANNHSKSISRIKSTFPMFKHAKNSDEASVTSFKTRGMQSLFKDSASTRHISISAPIPQSPGRDTLADISEGPYETAFERPSSRHPPMSPMPTYTGPPASRRVSNMSVINEYSSEDLDSRHSNDYNDDNTSQYNQGYPMTRRSSTPQAPRGRGGPHQWRRPASQKSRTLHRSQMTAFPGDTDPYMASMHGAMGNASYVPPVRPAVGSMKDKYRATAYSASQYTDVNSDEDRHLTRLY